MPAATTFSYGLRSKCADLSELLLGNFNVFAYAFRELDGPEDFSWLLGKAAGILAAVIMAGLLPHILKKRG